ncbi:MAG: hypothetical protein V4481_00865 [Patescibacteria group bacterium]
MNTLFAQFAISLPALKMLGIVVGVIILPVGILMSCLPRARLISLIGLLITIFVESVLIKPETYWKVVKSSLKLRG